MTWFDNYNAKWRHKMANYNRDSLSLASWTGVGVRHYTGPWIDMEIKHDDDGPIPAMPADPFIYESDVQNFITMISEDSTDYKQMSAIDRNSYYLPQGRVEQWERPAGMARFPLRFDKSFLKKWRADRVPLKPNVLNINVPEKYKAAIQQAPDTLANFYPKGVRPFSIGSHDGLIKLLKEYVEEKIIHGKRDKYLVLTCDENIYNRAVRVTAPSYRVDIYPIEFAKPTF